MPPRLASVTVPNGSAPRNPSTGNYARSTRWHMTWNNPSSIAVDRLREFCGDFFRYIAACYEVGAQGTPHLQIYCQTHKRVSSAELSRRFPWCYVAQETSRPACSLRYVLKTILQWDGTNYRRFADPVLEFGVPNLQTGPNGHLSVYDDARSHWERNPTWAVPRSGSNTEATTPIRTSPEPAHEAPFVNLLQPREQVRTDLLAGPTVPLPPPPSYQASLSIASSATSEALELSRAMTSMQGNYALPTLPLSVTPSMDPAANGGPQAPNIPRNVMLRGGVNVDGQDTKAAKKAAAEAELQAYVDLAKQKRWGEIPLTILASKGAFLREQAKGAFETEPEDPPLPDRYKNLWIWGGVNMGKTYTTLEAFRSLGLYQKDPTNKWFDGLTKEHKVILYDELNPEPARQHKALIKAISDKHPVPFEYKGGVIRCRPRHIIITSNWSIEHIFHDQIDRDALNKRFLQIQWPDYRGAISPEQLRIAAEHRVAPLIRSPSEAADVMKAAERNEAERNGSPLPMSPGGSVANPTPAPASRKTDGDVYFVDSSLSQGRAYEPEDCEPQPAVVVGDKRPRDPNDGNEKGTKATRRIEKATDSISYERPEKPQNLKEQINELQNRSTDIWTKVHHEHDVTPYQPVIDYADYTVDSDGDDDRVWLKLAKPPAKPTKNNNNNDDDDVMREIEEIEEAHRKRKLAEYREDGADDYDYQVELPDEPSNCNQNRYVDSENRSVDESQLFANDPVKPTPDVVAHVPAEITNSYDEELEERIRDWEDEHDGVQLAGDWRPKASGPILDDRKGRRLKCLYESTDREYDYTANCERHVMSAWPCECGHCCRRTPTPMHHTHHEWLCQKYYGECETVVRSQIYGEYLAYLKSAATKAHELRIQATLERELGALTPIARQLRMASMMHLSAETTISDPHRIMRKPADYANDVVAPLLNRVAYDQVQTVAAAYYRVLHEKIYNYIYDPAMFGNRQPDAQGSMAWSQTHNYPDSDVVDLDMPRHRANQQMGLEYLQK